MTVCPACHHFGFYDVTAFPNCLKQTKLSLPSNNSGNTLTLQNSRWWHAGILKGIIFSVKYNYNKYKSTSVLLPMLFSDWLP